MHKRHYSRVHAVRLQHDNNVKRMMDPGNSISGQYDEEAREFEITSGGFNAKRGKCPPGHIPMTTSMDREITESIKCVAVDKTGETIAKKAFRESQAQTLLETSLFQKIIGDFETKLKRITGDTIFRLALEGQPLSRAVFAEEISKLRLLTDIIAESLKQCAVQVSDNQTNNWKSDRVNEIVSGCGSFSTITIASAKTMFEIQKREIYGIVDRIRKRETVPVLGTKAQIRMKEEMYQQKYSWSNWFKRIWATIKAALSVLTRSLRPIAKIIGISAISMAALFGLGVYVVPFVASLLPFGITASGVFTAIGGFLCKLGKVELSLLVPPLALALGKMAQTAKHLYDWVISMIKTSGFGDPEMRERFKAENEGVPELTGDPGEDMGNSGIAWILLSFGTFIVGNISKVLPAVFGHLCPGRNLVTSSLALATTGMIKTFVENAPVVSEYLQQNPSPTANTTKQTDRTLAKESLKILTDTQDNLYATLDKHEIDKRKNEILLKQEQDVLNQFIPNQHDENLYIGPWQINRKVLYYQLYPDEEQVDKRKLRALDVKLERLQDTIYDRESVIEVIDTDIQDTKDNIKKQNTKISDHNTRARKFSAEYADVKRARVNDTHEQNERERQESIHKHEEDRKRMTMGEGVTKSDVGDDSNSISHEDITEDANRIIPIILGIASLTYVAGLLAFRMTANESPLTHEMDLAQTPYPSASAYFTSHDRLGPTIPDFLVFQNCRLRTGDAKACLQTVQDQHKMDQVTMIAKYRNMYIN